MSDEFTGSYYHQPSVGEDHDPRLRMNTGVATQMFDFDPNLCLSFSEFFNGSYHDQNMFSSAEGVSVARGEVTPDSSISSASDNEENSNKGKKEVVNKEKESFKQEEKKKKKPDQKKQQQQRQARYAFMTKSEVDHLEDGYRWRKYGQKAVKNNAYPRSYYRCTTQNCPVKKRVERSFEDSSVVVTTYEGQHNHHIPVALRGHLMSGMFAPSSHLSEGTSSFSQELLLAQTTMQQPHDYLYGGYGGVGDANNQHDVDIGLPTQQFNRYPDYGLLQDIIPPVLTKQE